MSSDLLDELQLRQALQPLLSSSIKPPIDEIRVRAHAQRRRRTRLVTGTVGAGVVCAALVAAGPLHLIAYGPGPAGDAPICTPTELTYYSGEAFLVEPQDLPDNMKLGWSADNLPPMKWGNARRIEHPCAHNPIHRLIDVENGVVVRTVDLNVTPLTTSKGDTNLAKDPPVATPLNGHGIYDTQDPHQAEIHGNSSSLVAGWNTGGYQYEIWANGLDRSGMQDLLDNVSTDGASIDASSWRSSADFEVQDATQVPPEGTDFSWAVTSEKPDGDGVPLGLEVAEGDDDLMMYANIGDTLTTVAGHQALQSRAGVVTWKPDDHTVVFVYCLLSDAELLEAAAKVTSMSSDTLPTR